jgi:hypothetical protein
VTTRCRGHTTAEELWECTPAEAVAYHGPSLEREAAFFRDGRYIRVYGNPEAEIHAGPDRVPVANAKLMDVLRAVRGGHPL